MPQESLRSAADAVRRAVAHGSNDASCDVALRGHPGIHTTTHTDLRARVAEFSV